MTPGGERERILIVEDDLVLQTCIRSLLRKEEFATAGAQCLEEAETRLSENRFDLIITDVHLAGPGSGLEILHLQPVVHLKIPVIVISGAKEKPLADTALKQGAFAFFKKPFDLNVFMRKCKEALILKRKKDAAVRNAGSAGWLFSTRDSF